MRNTYLSAFDLDENFDQYIASIRRVKPRLITAYTATMVKFSKMIQERGITDITSPIVIPTSENLYPEHRAVIEAAVHGKVYDRYGSRELGAVAGECSEQNGLHINAESFVVEYETKRLIITHLDKFGMPLIRYDTGDLGEPGDDAVCACGLAHPKIGQIDGRVTDFLKMKDGRLVPYLFFNYELEQYGALIRQFQVSQPDYDHVIIRIVAAEGFTAEKEKALIAKLEQGLPAKVRVERVAKIPLSKGGKFVLIDQKMS